MPLKHVIIAKPKRCISCDKRLFDACIIEGIVKIKCPKCGTLNTIEAKKSEPITRSHIETE